MKIEQLIVQHLYTAKNVTLQGIGTIHLNPTVSIPESGDKGAVIPENAFTFDYNLKAGEDVGLIDFIVQQTRKMKPLASSDLESYTMLAKQFLNIGKPLLIEGVGTIQKNQSGLYEFIQGVFVTPKIDDIPKQLKEKTEENISFESESRNTGHSKKYAAIAFIALFAVLTGLGLYYFIFKKKSASTEPVAQIQPLLQDTIKKIDTEKIKVPDTAAAAKPAEPIKTDSFNFKIVIREYKDAATAENKLKTFTDFGYKLILIKVDSAKYQLAMPFTTPLSDTLRTKDSLRKKIFGGNPYVILK